MRNALLLLIVVLSIGSANADSLTYTVTPTGAAFMYGFSLSNTGDTGGTLFDLFLSIPLDISDIDTGTIGTPVGWGDPTGGLLFFGPDASPSTSFIEWADDVSGLYDIGIGDSLDGFSFLSAGEIAGPITFALNGSTTFNAAEPYFKCSRAFSIWGIGTCRTLLRVYRRQEGLATTLTLLQQPESKPTSPSAGRSFRNPASVLR